MDKAFAIWGDFHVHLNNNVRSSILHNADKIYYYRDKSLLFVYFQFYKFYYKILQINKKAHTQILQLEVCTSQWTCLQLQ